MDKFLSWYYRNIVQITWFLVGWLSLAALHDFSRGEWLSLLLDVALIWFNLKVHTR
mgnify:CR=1 FL=1